MSPTIYQCDHLEKIKNMKYGPCTKIQFIMSNVSVMSEFCPAARAVSMRVVYCMHLLIIEHGFDLPAKTCSNAVSTLVESRADVSMNDNPFFSEIQAPPLDVLHGNTIYTLLTCGKKLKEKENVLQCS